MKIVKHEQNGTLYVSLQGSFSFSCHEEFRKILEQVSQEQITQLTINLKDVDFIDSAAMGMLLLAREEVEKYQKGLALVGADGQVKKMFDMANFKNIFTLL